jgi:hypothetical protein
VGPDGSRHREEARVDGEHRGQGWGISRTSSDWGKVHVGERWANHGVGDGDLEPPTRNVLPCSVCSCQMGRVPRQPRDEMVGLGERPRLGRVPLFAGGNVDGGEEHVRRKLHPDSHLHGVRGHDGLHDGWRGGLCMGKAVRRRATDVLWHCWSWRFAGWHEASAICNFDEASGVSIPLSSYT